jgi:hypothetical protein
VVVDMQVQPMARRRSEIYRAAVLNRAKLTYDGVSAWLDGGRRCRRKLAPCRAGGAAAPARRAGHRCGNGASGAARST